MKLRSSVITMIATSIMLTSPSSATAVVNPDRPVSQSEARWVVSVQMKFDGPKTEHVCTGSLIAADKVLTAGHCVALANSYPTQLYVLAGSHSLKSKSAQLIKVQYAVIHQHYLNVEEGMVGDAESYDSDIAVLFLERPVKSVKPALLAGDSYHRTPSGWRIYGWGTMNDKTEAHPSALQTTPVQDKTQSVMATSDTRYGKVLLAGGKVRGRLSGPCVGDSGGPLVDARGTVIGVTNYTGDASCQKSKWSAFADTAAFSAWIARVDQEIRSALDEFRAPSGIDPVFDYTYVVAMDELPVASAPVEPTPPCDTTSTQTEPGP